mgnify:CR=1 FL=1
MADIWGSIKKTVAKVAPVLGNAILPGVGGIAGTLLAEVLGVENDPEKIEVALQNATPEQLVKIKELEYAHKEKLIGFGVEQDRLYLADVQSARQREVDIVKTTGKKDINQYVLAWTIIVGFFLLCIFLLFRQIPQGQSDVIYLLFGGLESSFATVIGYFFGSSKCSAEKTALLAIGKVDEKK